MELIPLKCKNCSAALRVPLRVRFVTCEYCGSRLEIDHSRERLRSRVLANLKSAARAVEVSARRVSGAAGALHREVRQLRHRNELLHAEREIRHLDESWEQQRYVLCDRSGYPPSLIVETFWLVIRLLFQFGIIALAIKQPINLPWWSWTIATLIVVSFLVRSFLRVRRAFLFRAAKARYQNRREVLNWRLREIQGGRRRL